MFNALDEDLDIKSLRLLQVLLSECSVSRTADRLGRAQPSVSNKLKRLRAMFGDPLLVRSGQHMVRTEKGCSVLASVNKVLGGIDGMFDTVEMFEPATSSRTARIAGADCLATFLIPPFVRHLRETAPLMPIEFSTPANTQELLTGLECGDIDIAIGNWPEPPESLRCMPLMEAEFVCVMDAEHPYANCIQLELDEYLQLAHLSPTSPGESALSPVDGRLAQLGKRRRNSICVPGFGVIPSIIAGSDLVLTTARPLGEVMAGSSDLRAVAAPAEFGLMQLYMLWHEHAHNSTRNRWLRQTLLGETRRLTEAGTRRMPVLAPPIDNLNRRALP
ncbi:LysR family transcriptional regulator [Devosia pacifica]|uniref:LysR family transcriptional regulator n=1 Tax=Devosia pacifica TaxID=1335967 RepID=A0A918VNF0_9HYPH|nr:LysR family transcriptional regulator [Devosia pacifica]GHA10061.1 LysR family transcriptional regulator [Devosia pacifica]